MFLKFEVRLMVAIELYREGKVTLKQAAELAALYVEDFIKKLSRRKVSVVNWPVEELKEELKEVDHL
nr:UPF0175 family protein [Candidatus Baldrarchaeota archaeon]